jgi:cyclic pyranopterin phosphate synthase
MPESEVRRHLEVALGRLVPIDRASEPGVGPSVVYRLTRGAPRGRIGFISAMSQPFCSTCNRLRLTADGILRSCLFDGGEVEVRSILRNGAMNHATLTRALGNAMERCVRLRPLLHCEHGNEQMSRLGG